MDAFDVMTTAVVTAGPDTSTQEIAELLLEHGISAVPIVDDTGEVIGMVSEGDLLRLSDEDREARRAWWLAMLAEGENGKHELVASQTTHGRCARDVMSAPVVTVSEHTDVSEIGKLLGTHKIKRVPVLRDGQIVGIVSRADLVRALTLQSPAPSAHHGGLFDWGSHHSSHDEYAEPKARPAESDLSPSRTLTPRRTSARWWRRPRRKRRRISKRLAGRREAARIT